MLDQSRRQAVYIIDIFRSRPEIQSITYEIPMCIKFSPEELTKQVSLQSCNGLKVTEVNGLKIGVVRC